MGAEFDSTKTIDNIFQTSLLLAILCGSMFLVFIKDLFLSDKFIILELILGVITLLFTLICVIIADGCRVFITADNEKIIVVHTIFKKEFLHKNIEYNKIDCAECEVKAIGTRYGGIIYKMFLKLKMKDGSEISGFKELSIESELPVSRPDEYKRYVSEQPLQKLCDFINKQFETSV